MQQSCAAPQIIHILNAIHSEIRIKTGPLPDNAGCDFLGILGSD
jgi:hypothetical protein